MSNSEKINQILTSSMGKEILSEISPIYDNADKALHLLQSIGLRHDDLKAWVEDLWNQLVPQTATWALRYFEQEYGLAINTSLPITQRRELVLNAIRSRLPINPYRLASIAQAACGYPCRIEERTGPNTFDIYISASEFVSERSNALTIKAVKGTNLASLIAYGDTSEIGSGDKSPSTPYGLSGVEKVTVNGTDYALPQALYSLPDGVSDTFDAVAGAGTLKIGKAVLNGSESWLSNPPWDTQAPDYLHAYSHLNDKKPNVMDSLVSTHFPVVYAWGSHLAENRIYSETASNVIYIFIAKAFLPTPDIAGLKAWLAANPVTVLYQLATPATITGTPQTIPATYPETTISVPQGEVSVSYKRFDENLIRTPVDTAKPAHLIYNIKYEQGIQGAVYVPCLFYKAVITSGRQVN